MAYRKYYRHSNPKKLDTPIWRYMSMGKFNDLQKTSEIYSRSGALFDDLFEGSFPDFVKRQPVTEESPEDENFDEWYEREMVPVGEEMERFLFHENVRPITYINCWTVKSHECVAMWSLYLRGRERAAIRTTLERLIKSLTSEQKDIFISRVSYIEHGAKQRPKGLRSLNPCLLEHQAYRFESELRMFCEPFNQDNLPNLNDHPEGIRIAIELFVLIETVVLSPGSSDESIENVEGIVANYGNHSESIISTALDRMPFYY